jgi:phenylacetate-coenzyme A ligase PaaK-like adenylate-forming protein
VVVGGAFTLGQLQDGAVLPTLAGQNITISANFPPSDPDRAVCVVRTASGCTGMPLVTVCLSHESDYIPAVNGPLQGFSMQGADMAPRVAAAMRTATIPMSKPFD